MAKGGEMRGFVFSIVFIIVFSTLLSSISVGLRGTGGSPDTVIPVDPSLITGFTASENYTGAVFSVLVGSIEWYQYDLGGRSWVIYKYDTYFLLRAKVLIFGFLWFGQIDDCKFVSSTGEDRGTELAFTEIESDATNGTIRYTLTFITDGNSAGGFVLYWNTTAYSDPSDAWDADKLYLLHGVGISETATANIGALIISLLLIQLPDVPVLVNMFLAVPIWACIVYVLWYIIKEMIPFL